MEHDEQKPLKPSLPLFTSLTPGALKTELPSEMLLQLRLLTSIKSIPGSREPVAPLTPLRQLLRFLYNSLAPGPECTPTASIQATSALMSKRSSIVERNPPMFLPPKARPVAKHKF